MIRKAIKSAIRSVITELDFDRLNELAQSRHYRVTHSALLMGLKSELDRGKVVRPTRVPSGVVTMNSRVRLRDLRSKASETFTLVYPDAADVSQEKLSVLAPLGAALLGSRAGQTIEVKTPGGLRRLTVERILYQPEAAGDYHL
jgi:regulator of nucleoside diphosphate kinase